MKKMSIIIALATITFWANAKVLRVSNVSGSSAPYSNYVDAERDAIDGDTIMFEGSETPYYAEGDTMKVNKRVTIKGPGYFLTENEISNENGATAQFGRIRLNVDGIVLCGVEVNEVLICSSNNVITRNYISGEGLTFNYNVTKSIIHQNYIAKSCGLFTSYPADDKLLPSYIQITNNIFTGSARFLAMEYITIKNNTFTNTYANSYGLFIVSNSTIENNIGGTFNDLSDGNVGLNNIPDDKGYYIGKRTEKEIYEVDSNINEGIYGAFAGEDPYVLSGIPSGPVIEDIELPASVAKGTELNVNVKIGISR